jgi:hypothetical protein
VDGAAPTFAGVAGMSAPANGQAAVAEPKSGDANAEIALSSPISGCPVSCNDKQVAIVWRKTCFEHHP